MKNFLICSLCAVVLAALILPSFAVSTNKINNAVSSVFNVRARTYDNSNCNVYQKDNGEYACKGTCTYDAKTNYGRTVELPGKCVLVGTYCDCKRGS